MDKRQMKRNCGFTLVELLIVVSIILILTVIATPRIIGLLQEARETSAVATLNSIHDAQMIYQRNHGVGTLADLAAAEVLDGRFAEDDGSPTLGGYQYSITMPDEDDADYYIQADPVGAASGRYDFFAGPDGVVRYRTTLGGVEAGAAVQ